MVFKTEGEELVIRIPLNQAEGQTRNGNILVASTHGWVPIAPGTTISLNVVRKSR